MAGPLATKPYRSKHWSFWIGAAAVSLISVSGVNAQFPTDPPAAGNRGIPSLFPSQEKSSATLLNAGTPPTPTMVMPNMPSQNGLGLGAVDSNTIVTQINFVGNRRMPTAELKNQITSREGQPYNAEKLRNDVRKLDGTGRYIGGVRVEEYQTPQGVILTFHVIERSFIEEIQYQGARHVSREDLETASGLRKGMPMSVALNRVAAQKIEELYHRKGRYFAQVHIADGSRPEDAKVVFQITEGPVVKVSKLQIVGAQFVPSAVLEVGSKMEVGDGLFGIFGTEFSPGDIENDIAKIVDYYRSFGFFDVKVRKHVKYNADMSGVEVAIVVDEGMRYLIKDVRVAGNKQLDTEILLAHNTLKMGENYNAKVMQAGLRKMNDEYGRRGILNTKVVPEFNYSTEPGSVTVVYKVEEGPAVAYAGDIKVIGNRVTRDDVVRQQLRFYPGQILDATKIRESERNLARLGIFKMDPASGVAPRIYLQDPDVPSPYKDVIVEVEEDRTGSFNIGAAVGSDAGINATVSLFERNFDILRPPTSIDDIFEGRAFRGGGQQFMIRAQPGNEFSNYSVSWTEPFLFNSDYSLTLSGYYNNRFFLEYHEQRTGGRVGIGKRLTDEWVFSVGFRAEEIKVSGVPATAPSDYVSVLGSNSLFAPRVGFIRDTRDSFLRATEGNRFEVGVEQALGSFSFPSVTMEDSQYFTVYQRPDGSGRHVFMLHGLVGASGSDTPVYERYFAGGARNLRGFTFRGVGPVKNGYKVGGNFQMIGTAEYQVPLTAGDNLFAVAFCDFGTVEDDVAIRDFRMSVGGGLRIMIPQLSPAPIALDFGFPLMKKDSDETQVFSFTLGISY